MNARPGIGRHTLSSRPIWACAITTDPRRHAHRHANPNSHQYRPCLRTNCALTSSAQTICIFGCTVRCAGVARTGAGLARGTGISIRGPLSLLAPCGLSCASGHADCGGGGPVRLMTVRQDTLTVHTTRLIRRWRPNITNWLVSRKPATKDMTSTAVGHAVHATARRKSIRATVEIAMQRMGRRQERQKNMYLLYTSFARR